MFKLKSNKTLGEVVKGIFMKPIAYEVRIPSANWIEYFGKYQNQKWGIWDSNSCWVLSAINCVEDQLEWLWENNMFSDEAKTFFVDNKYIDSDGDFSLSERFLEILSGVHDNGNNQMEAWRLMQIYGCIPRSDLTYTQEQAFAHPTKQSFNADYFDINAISPEMRDKGQKFLKYVNISRQWIGTQWRTPNRDILINALKQAPLQIGIPVPHDGSWNASYVKSPIGNTNADHAVELYGINENGEYLIFDQYMPNLKTLSKDYYIPFVTSGIVNAVSPVIVNPIVQDLQSNGVWEAIIHWFNGIFDSKVPIGNINN
jgi:hypothetical protein